MFPETEEKLQEKYTSYRYLVNLNGDGCYSYKVGQILYSKAVLVELPMTVGMFYITAVRCGSHWPRVAHLKSG